MSAFMEIHTALEHDDVLARIGQGCIGRHHFELSTAKTGGLWAGQWDRGVFCIDSLAQEDLEELRGRLHLPATLKTRLWLTTPDIHRDQEAVHDIMATALREWKGDMALLNGGDTVEVQRVNGAIQARSDYLSAGSLAAYKGLDWRPFQPTDFSD